MADRKQTGREEYTGQEAANGRSGSTGRDAAYGRSVSTGRKSDTRRQASTERKVDTRRETSAGRKKQKNQAQTSQYASRSSKEKVSTKKSRTNRAGSGNPNLRRKKKKKNYILEILMAIFALVIVILLLIGNRYCKTHFIKGTIINEIDASGMEVSQLEQQMRQYQIEIKQKAKDGSYVTEKITGDQIGVTVANMDEVTKILKQQNIFKAMYKTLKKQESIYEVDHLYQYVDEALLRGIKKLKGFQADFVQEPVDAHMTDYSAEGGYQVIPEIMGNQLNEKKTIEVITHAVDALLPSVDLASEDCYETPKVYEDDPRFLALLPQLKKYTETEIVYHFGDTDEVINGELIDTWLSIDEDTFEVTLDQEKVNDYVVFLRKKYDTIFRSRPFKTSIGKEITVSGGDYGWWMNYAEEQKALYEMLENGESGEREPIYYQTAAFYGEKDYGDSYVEVNLTAQHLYVYVDGKMVLDSDFVSGNAAKSLDTPEGIYGITYKETDAMLVGEDYETPVSYWMPFNKNIGLHDAIWRDAFGGQLYLTKGSHGCINLPYKIAKQIYSYVQKGMPVICYHLDGTQTTTTTPQSAQAKAQSAIDAIDKIGTVTKDSEKKIQRARQLYQEVGEEAREYVTNYDTLKSAEAAFKEYKK